MIIYIRVSCNYVCLFCVIGKHDTPSLLLCDSCDNEWHTYCLSPPLESIPDGHWFCCSCIKLGKDKEIVEEEQKQDEENAVVVMSDENGDDNRHKKNSKKSIPVPMEEEPVVRRPGRPKGSVGKKRAELLHTVFGGDSRAMQLALRARKKLPGKKSRRRRGKGSGYDYEGNAESDAPRAPTIVITEPVGIEGTCAIAARASRRLLLPSEVLSLESFREWAPLADLKQALEAFKSQKALLTKRSIGDISALTHTSEASPEGNNSDGAYDEEEDDEDEDDEEDVDDDDEEDDSNGDSGEENTED